MREIKRFRETNINEREKMREKNFPLKEKKNFMREKFEFFFIQIFLFVLFSFIFSLLLLSLFIFL